jgi:hypothetical protein
MVRVKKTLKKGKTFSKEKEKEKSKVMTIPQLRKAFEHMEKFRDLETFRKEWKKTFGKEVSKEAAEDYLKFVKASGSGKQSGGASHLAGAPLDYTTRPGTDLPYGSYPQYVSGGFGFANIDGISAQCGKETNLWPGVPASSVTGSNEVMKGGKRNKTRKQKVNQKGGSFPSLGTAISEFLQRPFGMGSPPTIAQDLQMVAKGVNTLPSPRPEVNTLPFTQSPVVYNANISTSSRTV